MDARNILEIQAKPIKKYAHAAPAKGEISGTLEIHKETKEKAIVEIVATARPTKNSLQNKAKQHCHGCADGTRSHQMLTKQRKIVPVVRTH